MKKKYADMDSLEEVRAIKEEIAREFPTAEALGEYLMKKFPMNLPPKPPRKSRRASAKDHDHPVPHRRKTAVHA